MQSSTVEVVEPLPVTTTTEDRIAPLDGLRGIAVILVFAHHTLGASLAPKGYVFGFVYEVAKLGNSGVDLFFVLSGFLITRILLANRTAENYYRTFYMRRVLRIFPIYYGMLVLTFFVFPMLPKPPLLGLEVNSIPWKTQLWYWFNLSNFPTAFNPLLVPTLGNFWSLAIEEQFYLIWPSVVRRCSETTLRNICIVGAILPLLLRESRLIPTFGAVDFFYRLTIFHMEGLFMGAGLALLERKAVFPRRALITCSVVGLSVVLLYVRYGGQTLSLGLSTAFALFYTGLVGLCAFGSRLGQLFSAPSLRSTGRYSYFIYVFHVVVLNYLGAYRWLGATISLFPYAVTIIAVSLIFLIVYWLGSVSWKRFEGPILRLNKRFTYD